MDVSTTTIQKKAEVAQNVTEDSSKPEEVMVAAPAVEIKTKTGESFSTQDPSFMTDIVRAFSAAYIPLTTLNIPGLLEYLRDNVEDPAAPASSEQLKHCYQRFISEELDSPPFCSVTGCSTSYADRRTIFGFPDCKESIKLWKQALGLKYLGRFVRGGGVCELHFDEDFLIRDSDGSRVTLMPGAVPKNEEPQIIKTDLMVNKHCRMCGLAIKNYMQHTITDMLADQHLRPVLDLCLELNDSTHQLLPVTVCDGCANMVRFIGGYAKNCWDAQQKLLQRYTGTMGRKVEPWNRVYQYVENEEIIHAEGTQESAPSGAVQQTAKELITGNSNGTETAHVEEISTEICSVEPNIEEKDTPKPILIKTEPLEKNIEDNIPASSAVNNDENEDIKLNKQDSPPPVKKPRRSREPISNISGEQVEKFTCKICLLHFNKQTELVIHNRKHAREQKDVKPDVLLSGWFLEAIKCLQCRKTFPTPEELKSHTSKEHKCDAYCPICGMRFRNNEVLEQHRKRAKRCLKKPDEPSKAL